MAIAFNLPSEREATEESYSRLNRLLAELYDVLCHILVSRQTPGVTAAAAASAPAPDPPEPHERPRDRPFSDSDLERPGFSGLPDVVQPPPARRRPRSANPLHLPPLADFTELEDDVFVSPRMDNGNDPFSNPRNVEIFGSPRNGSPRTPAGLLLSPRGRAERRFTFSVTSEKHWRDKGGTVDEADGLGIRSQSTLDETDSAGSSKISSQSEGSLFSCILPDKLSGSICTAVLFMLGWKLLVGKR